MVDSIGLGSAIANLIYIIVFAVGIFGVVLFLKRKAFLNLFVWISLVLNFYFYLHLMGRYAFYPKAYYGIINKYWPLINLGLLIWVVISYIRGRKKKSIQ